MPESKFTRTAVIMVQLADADEDPTSTEARVIGVRDRQVFYALQRYVFLMERQFSAALRKGRKERRRFSLGDEMPLPLPSYECGND